MELKELLTLFEDEAAFKSAVAGLLSEEIDDHFLDELDDKMLEASKENFEQVKKLCKVLVALYKEYGRNFSLAYTYNTLLACQSQMGDATRVLETLDTTIEHCIEVSAKEAGISAIHNTTSFIFSSNLPVEAKLALIARCKEFYIKFELYEELVESYIAAAFIFCDHGAFQPAYRILADTEEIVEKQQNLRLFGRVVSAGGGVSIREGDHEYAIKKGLECIEFLEDHGVRPEPELLVNIGTAYQREDEPEKALEQYEKLVDYDDDELREAQIMTNMSVCKRKLGDVAGAITAANSARSLLEAFPEEHESLFELELITANNFIAAGDTPETIASLGRVVAFIEALLKEATRLYYRRGVRERYVNRIEPMIRKLPAEGSAETLYKLIALCRTSAASDWLHLLDWYDEILINDNIPAELKESLSVSIRAIRNFGAPFLYGYREKYDDPFETIWPPSPWEEFTSLLVTLRERYDLPSPYEGSSTEIGAALLKKRCEDERCCCIISLKSALLFLHGGRYYIAPHDPENTKNFFVQLNQYRSGQCSLQEFAPNLAAITASLEDIFDSAVAALGLEECREIIFMPDQLECVPLVPSIMNNSVLRAKVANGTLTFRVTPIFYEGDPADTILRTMVGLSDDSFGLPLSAAELENIERIAELERLNPDGRVPEDLSGVDLIAITTHGFPITSFTDPIFANLGGHDSDKNLYFETIQRTYVEAPYKLALLNSCYSGVSVPRNYFKTFSTHETPGFPTLLLLNRRAAVIACEWGVVDKIAYIFSDTLFKALSEGESIKKAYANTILKISTLGGGEARNILASITDTATGDSTMAPPTDKYFENMLSHPYCYGTFQLFTLF